MKFSEEKISKILIGGLFQFSCTFVKYLTLKQRMGTKLDVSKILKFH